MRVALIGPVLCIVRELGRYTAYVFCISGAERMGACIGRSAVYFIPLVSAYMSLRTTSLHTLPCILGSCLIAWVLAFSNLSIHQD